MPKRTVLDPQGKTVKHALESMSFKGIKDVRIGKFIEVELAGGNKAALKKKIDDAEVVNHLTRREVEDLFDLDVHLRQVNHTFKKVGIQ